jgi:hypothetical protein
MLKMLQDEALRARVIPAARQRVLQNFDNKVLIRELAAIYQNEIEAFKDLEFTKLHDVGAEFPQSPIRNLKSKI